MHKTDCCQQGKHIAERKTQGVVSSLNFADHCGESTSVRRKKSLIVVLPLST